MALLQRQQLVEGVELHELQTGLREDFRTRHPPEGFFHHAVCPGVPVMKRLAEQFAVLRQQRKVHAPGVSAHRDDVPSVFFARQRQAVLDLGPEAQHIPAQRARQRHRAVGKTMEFLQPKGFTIPQPGDDASAFSAEINSQMDWFGHGQHTLTHSIWSKAASFASRSSTWPTPIAQ